MRRIISCQFNIDTACVDVEYEDGFVLSIYARDCVMSPEPNGVEKST